MVKAKLNILISGGTGSGKTTLLNMLSGFIPDNERIITIEDSAELQLQQEHVVRLETRPPNIEGKGEITQRDLVRNALRMRPDRIIVGEVPRGRGHGHAPGHEHRPRRLHDHRARQHHPGRPGPPGDHDFPVRVVSIHEKAMRQLISSSLDIIIQLARHSDGIRRMVAVWPRLPAWRAACHQHAGYLRL